MALFNIYLATTIFSIVVTSVKILSVNKRLKREGYVSTGKSKNKSLPEKISDIMSNSFKVFIPLYNVLNSVILLWLSDDDLFEIVAKNMIKKGHYKYDPNADQTKSNVVEKMVSQVVVDLSNGKVLNTEEFDKRLEEIRKQKNDLANLREEVIENTDIKPEDKEQVLRKNR